MLLSCEATISESLRCEIRKSSLVIYRGTTGILLQCVWSTDLSINRLSEIRTIMGGNPGRAQSSFCWRPSWSHQWSRTTGTSRNLTSDILHKLCERETGSFYERSSTFNSKVWSCGNVDTLINSSTLDMSIYWERPTETSRCLGSPLRSYRSLSPDSVLDQVQREEYQMYPGTGVMKKKRRRAWRFSRK